MKGTSFLNFGSKGILCLLFLVPVNLSMGQESPRHRFPFLGLSGHSGFIIPHADELKDISRSTPFGFQAEAGFIHTSPKAYAQTMSFARLGMSLQHMQFGNSRELGSSTALTTFLEPYFLAQSKFQFSFRFGIGATYLNRVYHPVDNPRNVFFSSPISFITYLAFTSRYSLNKNLKAQCSIFYNHISNGGARMPNKGINFPTLSLGMEYLPFSEQFVKPDVFPKKPKGLDFFLEVGFSGKNTPPRTGQNSEMVLIFNLSAQAEKKISQIHGFSLGLEFTEDQYQKKDFEYWNINRAHQTLGLMLGHGFHLGKVKLTQQYGFYLFNQDPNRRVAYQRYGLYYQAFEKLYFGGTLKVHRHVADIFDVRVGYKF